MGGKVTDLRMLLAKNVQQWIVGELAHAGHPIGATEVLRMIHEIGMSNAWAHQNISTARQYAMIYPQ